MDMIMNGLLIAGAVFAGAYCWVLSSRVQALKSLDTGLGGAIVTLTRQIELARATLDEARAASRDTRHDLTHLVARSDAAAAQLRLLLAAIETSGPAITAQAAVHLGEASATATPAPPVDAPDPAPRRREAQGPRLVPAPDPSQEPDAPLSIFASDPVEPAGLPKPRRTAPLDGLLRRRAPAEPPAARSEADLMAALSAMAAGGER